MRARIASLGGGRQGAVILPDFGNTAVQKTQFYLFQE